MFTTKRHTSLSLVFSSLVVLAASAAVSGQPYLPNVSSVGAPRTDPRPVATDYGAVERGALMQTRHSRGSRIVYRDRCGWQGSGQVAYVQNSTGKRSVITIRESYSSGQQRWSRTQSYSLEPGAEQWVGCTRGDTSVEWKGFSITGERAR